MEPLYVDVSFLMKELSLGVRVPLLASEVRRFVSRVRERLGVQLFLVLDVLLLHLGLRRHELLLHLPLGGTTCLTLLVSCGLICFTCVSWCQGSS